MTTPRAPVEKICANTLCARKFVPGPRKYCCGVCRRATLNRIFLKRHPEARVYKARGFEQWKKAHPERVNAQKKRSTAKNYLAGKLPSWMYS